MRATKIYFCLFYSFFELYNLYSIIELGTRWRSQFPILHVGGHVKTAWVYMLPFSGMNEIRYSGIVKWEKVSSIFSNYIVICRLNDRLPSAEDSLKYTVTGVHNI